MDLKRGYPRYKVARHRRRKHLLIPMLAAYFAAMVVMVFVDLLWLGAVAKPLYQQGIGHLLAARPVLPAAAVFYLVFPLGLLLFAIAPDGVAARWSGVLTKGALFGLFAYATYGLTNLAMLRDWPVDLVLIDIAWGTAISALSAAAGSWAWNWAAG